MNKNVILSLSPIIAIKLLIICLMERYVGGSLLLRRRELYDRCTLDLPLDEGRKER